MTFTFNRRPFNVTRDGMLINGTLSLDVAVDKTMNDDQLAAATQATNDRFERVLAASEDLSPIDQHKYQVLIDTFVERIVLPACST